METMETTETTETTEERLSQVLVVDDDCALRRVVRMCLEDDGYTVCEAGDGAEALSQFQHATEPLLVLLDYRMPIMDGWEVLRQVAAQPALLARHAFLLTTAEADMLPAPFTHLLREHGVGVLPKPFNLRQLSTLVGLAARARVDDQQKPAPESDKRQIRRALLVPVPVLA